MTRRTPAVSCGRWTAQSQPGRPPRPPSTWRRLRLSRAGDVDAMRAALFAAFVAARAANDGEGIAAAALAMPTSQRFGVFPGQIPALMHEAYGVTSSLSTRCRLAAALARSWVYGGDAERALRFAEDARRLAAEVATPETAADALDAALLAHWGPDDFREQVEPGVATRRRRRPPGRPRASPLRAPVAAHHRMGMPRHRRRPSPAAGPGRGCVGIGLGSGRLLCELPSSHARACDR